MFSTGVCFQVAHLICWVFCSTQWTLIVHSQCPAVRTERSVLQHWEICVCLLRYTRKSAAWHCNSKIEGLSYFLVCMRVNLVAQMCHSASLNFADSQEAWSVLKLLLIIDKWHTFTCLLWMWGTLRRWSWKVEKWATFACKVPSERERY